VLLFSVQGSCSAEKAYLMTQSQLDKSKSNLILLSQINQQSQAKSEILKQQLTESKQAIAESNSQLQTAKQQLTQALSQTQQQATQITQLQIQIQKLQATSENQERLLASYKQSLTTYLNTHKRPDWELGVGGGYADGGEYSIEVQRNYSSKNAIAFEYLGGNVKGFLAKIKILF
jgi:hypothetical protein